MARRVEPVDPSQDDLLDGLWEVDLDVVVDPPPLVFPHQRSGVDQRPDQLLQVERIAFGVAEDPRFQPRRKRVRPDHGVEQVPVRIARQRLQGDLPGAMGERARGDFLDLPGGVVALRPHGDDQQDRGVFGQREEPLGELDRGGVGPVKVVDGHRDRAVLGEPCQERADDFERPVLERFGRQLG